MCIGVPMKVVEFESDFGMGTCEIDGVTREVNLSLLDPEEVKEGVWVLVHAGFGVSVVDEAYVQEAKSTIAEIESQSDDLYKSW
jgi:hydrogenase expression/formation protein HypC